MVEIHLDSFGMTFSTSPNLPISTGAYGINNWHKGVEESGRLRQLLLMSRIMPGKLLLLLNLPKRVIQEEAQHATSCIRVCEDNYITFPPGQGLQPLLRRNGLDRISITNVHLWPPLSKQMRIEGCASVAIKYYTFSCTTRTTRQCFY
jgi:hypothetical protein